MPVRTVAELHRSLEWITLCYFAFSVRVSKLHYDMFGTSPCLLNGVGGVSPSGYEVDCDIGHSGCRQVRKLLRQYSYFPYSWSDLPRRNTVEQDAARGLCACCSEDSDHDSS